MPFILAIDYDGTLFTKSYPEKGEPIQKVIDKVKEFKKYGAEICLWTCREDISLKEAVERCKEVGLEFDAINDNAPSQKEYMKKKLEEGEIFATRKIFADFYLDDKSHNLEFFLKIDARATCESYNKRN
jgi:ribonucleotide monophosphatase NagD (HAD superfamily)